MVLKLFFKFQSKLSARPPRLAKALSKKNPSRLISTIIDEGKADDADSYHIIIRFGIWSVVFFLTEYTKKP